MGDGGWVPPGRQAPVDDDGGARDATPADATAVDGVPRDAVAPVPGAAQGGAARPAGRRRRRLVVAGALAVAAAGTAAVVAALTVDRGSTDDRAAERGSESAPTSTASTPPPSPSTSVEPPGPPPTETVTSPGGDFTLDLPDEFWLVGFPGTGVPLAEQMVAANDYGPDGRIELLEDTLVTPMTRMVAIDRKTWLRLTPSDIVLVEGMGGLDTTGRDLDEVVELALPTREGVLVGARGRMAGAAGEVAWYEVHLDASEHSGVMFIVLGSDSVWHLTYWSEDLDAARSVADAIAASFAPG